MTVLYYPYPFLRLITNVPIYSQLCHQWGSVKESIEAQNNELKREGMKLILKGKILKDDGTVEGSGVTDKDFVVCMVRDGMITLC